MSTVSEHIRRQSLNALEWPAIFDRLLEHCRTPFGILTWESETFLDGPDAIRRHLAEVDTLKILLLRYGEPVLDGEIPDIRPALRRVAKRGELNARELGQILGTLVEGGKMLRHFSKGAKKESARKDAMTALDWLHDFPCPEAVREQLAGIIEPGGDMLDSASEELARLRESRRSQRNRIHEGLQKFLHTPEYAQALQDPIITERDGRYVLPVRVEFKAKIPGVVHAGSSSGATIFVEPCGVVDLNNRLQEIEADLHREIRRVLKETSAYLQAHAEELLAFTDLLGRLDKRTAAARLARQLEAEAPKVMDDQRLALKQVRHPLLLLNRPNRKEVVANDVLLGGDHRTMVITGPNTGGKTVLLKTAGLCALMVRAGLLIPAAEGSEIAVFDPVLADIGDQQNISQDLSTFSAHLEQLRAFLDPQTDLSRGLVMIDEIAAGTDPAEGAALARAVLDELHARGGLTIVTTHLGELKLEAHQHSGYLNASVEFDPENLRPTYRLILGVPGTSNAITIARRLGLSDSVIEKAWSFLSRPHRESAELIEELELKNRKLEEELSKAESYRKSTQESWEKVEWTRQQMESEKRSSLQQFKHSLKDRIHQLEAEIRHLRKELQSSGANAVDAVSGRLKNIDKQAGGIFEDTYEEIGKETPRLNLDDLKPGDEARSKRWNLKGEVLAVDADAGEVILLAGNMKVTVPLADLEIPTAYGKKLEKKSKPKRQEKTGGSVTLASDLDVGLECNVMGMRVEQALEKVQEYLDKASLAGYESVGIIHGHGTGALKKAIRQYLEESPYARRFRPGDPTGGGDGKTIVELG